MAGHLLCLHKSRIFCNDIMPELSALIPYFTLFAGTFLAVLAIVPIASAIARLVGLVDAPDARRKFHSNAVPLVGGVSVFLGMVIACSIVFLFFPNEIFGNQLTSSKVIQVVGLLVAATIIVVIGVIDDRFGIRGRQKLLGQIFVSLIVIGTGTWVFSFRVSDKTFDLRDAWTRTSQPQVSALHEVIDSDANAKLLEIERQTKAGEVRVSEADRQNEAVARRSKVLKANVARSYPAITVLYRGLALLAGAFTVFWIVGAINSVNLIDGADGLAGTTTFIISASLAIIAIYTGDYVEGAIAISLAGAILGFLVFNFPPAKIFFGDAGSMLIGLVLASLAVQSFLKEAMIYICIAQFAMLFIPIFDSATAFTRRLTTGRSIYSTDRGHLHHTLLRHGLTNRGMVLFVGGLTLVTAVGAVLTVINRDPSFAIIGVATVVVFLISARVFGWAEFRLLCSRIFRFSRSFFKIDKAVSEPSSETVQLQGSKEWHKVWEAITEFGERHDFHKIKLDLNLPWLHEGFHAVWSTNEKFESEDIWQTRIPLAANGRVYGRMEVSGVVSNESIYLVLMLMSDLLETLEPALARLADGEGDSVSVPALQTRQEKSGEHPAISLDDLAASAK